MLDTQDVEPASVQRLVFAEGCNSQNLFRPTLRRRSICRRPSHVSAGYQTIHHDPGYGTLRRKPNECYSESDFIDSSLRLVGTYLYYGSLVYMDWCEPYIIESYCGSRNWLYIFCTSCQGEGPGAVVKAAGLKSRRSRVRAPLWHLNFKVKHVSSPLTRKESIL